MPPNKPTLVFVNATTKKEYTLVRNDKEKQQAILRGPHGVEFAESSAPDLASMARRFKALGYVLEQR